MRSIKILATGEQKERQLLKLVEYFVSKVPHLESQQKALGNCKLASYELARFLRQRGVKAKIYHMKGYSGPAFESPHERWQLKKPEKWSHYVVVADKKVIDCSRRQFDRKCPHPYVCPVSEYKEVWNRFHFDKFLNKFLDRYLKAGIR